MNFMIHGGPNNPVLGGITTYERMLDDFQIFFDWMSMPSLGGTPAQLKVTDCFFFFLFFYYYYY
jgi:hypothetical protein